MSFKTYVGDLRWTGREGTLMPEALSFPGAPVPSVQPCEILFCTEDIIVTQKHQTSAGLTLLV